MIYPLYGVFSPTTQDYIDIFANYVSQNKAAYRHMRSVADLGCGTGILGILMNQLADFKGDVYAFDKETNCIEAARMNSQIFGMSDVTKPVELDIIDFYFPR